MWLVTPKHGGRFGGSPMISGSSCMQLANSLSKSCSICEGNTNSILISLRERYT